MSKPHQIRYRQAATAWVVWCIDKCDRPASIHPTELKALEAVMRHTRELDGYQSYTKPIPLRTCLLVIVATLVCATALVCSLV